MDASNNQSWILPRLADFLRTRWPDGDGGVKAYQAGGRLYEAYAVHLAEQGTWHGALKQAADDGPTGETRRRHVVNWGRQIVRLMEQAELASEGKPFSHFKRRSMVRFLQAARIVVRGPAPNGSDRQRLSIADLMALIDEADEGNANAVEIVIGGIPGFVRVLPRSGLTAEQIQDQLVAREEEQDWIRTALRTFVPKLAWPEMIETLDSFERSFMLADDAPVGFWMPARSRGLPSLFKSPAILKKIQNHEAAWERKYGQRAVMRVLSWALAPLCHRWQALSEPERLDLVAGLLKVADIILAAEVKAHNYPERVPYSTPQQSTSNLSVEE